MGHQGRHSCRRLSSEHTESPLFLPVSGSEPFVLDCLRTRLVWNVVVRCLVTGEGRDRVTHGSSARSLSVLILHS